MGKTFFSFWIFICCLIPCTVYSQGSFDKIFVRVVQPQRDNIPNEALKQLENKMTQMITSNGVAETDPNNRFVITSKVSILSKDITYGPPQRVSMNMDFTFMIGDLIENKVYESTTISVIGVGINENKAFISGITGIKTKNKEIVDFLNRAKQKIVDYYTRRCAQIKQEAANSAAMRDYDAAIYALMQVPEICDCSDECQDLMIQYNTEKINSDAAQLLQEAQTRWSESPNASGASIVADIMAKIPAGTPSQSSVEALQSEINRKLKADEKKEWEFKMQKYKDDVEKQKRDDAARAVQQQADNEYRAKQQQADNERRLLQQQADNQYRQKQQAADIESRKQTIEACRQVGLEYAKNQPQTQYEVVYLW